MELQEINAEKERTNDYEGTSNPMMEANPEEEAEPDHYSKLQNPPEDIYTEASFSDSPLKAKAGKQTEGNARLYRAGCLILTIICLVLLLAVIILSLKFQTGSPVCPKTEEAKAVERQSPSIAPTCDYQQCQALFPDIQPHHLGCQQCKNGWLTFGRSCFYLSTFRLPWDLSQRNCTARGGSLAVITSQRVQRFLTNKGNLNYWIGLRQTRNTWTWVNNTALQESYWADVLPAGGDCGILSSVSLPEKNWIKASCEASTYFICQLQY